MGLFSSGDDDERDAKYVIIDEQRDGRGSGGTNVTIPTQSNEKSISQAGWSVGGFIERSTSSGKVVDEPLEAYCVLFLVREHEIVVGLREKTKSMLPSKEPSKTLYIGYDEIRGINFPSGGRILGRAGPTTLQTAKDEFKFDQLVSKHSDVSYDELEEFILSKMKESKISNGENQGMSGNTESIADEIEQLSNLYRNGALSEEEFEAAKERILNQE